MSLTVRPCASLEEVGKALAPIVHYFGARPTAEDLDRWNKLLDVRRVHAAIDGSAYVGGAGAYTFEMTVPGERTVRAAGVTVVGVLPTHRRRGVLRAMMRAQLDDVHERGEPVAYLWASEETIYGRFGYGLASLCGEVEIPRLSSAFARPIERRTDGAMLEEDAALEPFSAIYERVRPHHPGMPSRTPDWWRERRLSDPESRRRGGGVLNRVLLTSGGEPQAYALYRLNQNLESGVSSGHVNVLEAIGATPQATAEIWRLLLDIDWVGSIKAHALPMDHPLFLLLANPRRMRFRVGDSLWVRLVDVAAAFASRSIGGGDPVVLEVSDPFCPWNEGRYALGEGTVERTRADADISLDVNALGSVYLGGFRFADLLHAGRIVELREGAAARADALLPRDRAPWCPEIF
ncbi:MAG: GNAT family N-acetyltransferase [Candidatus Eisenbacteria bacterium]